MYLESVKNESFMNLSFSSIFSLCMSSKQLRKFIESLHYLLITKVTFIHSQRWKLAWNHFQLAWLFHTNFCNGLILCTSHTSSSQVWARMNAREWVLCVNHFFLCWRIIRMRAVSVCIYILHTEQSSSFDSIAFGFRFDSIFLLPLCRFECVKWCFCVWWHTKHSQLLHRSVAWMYVKLCFRVTKSSQCIFCRSFHFGFGMKAFHSVLYEYNSSQM